MCARCQPDCIAEPEERRHADRGKTACWGCGEPTQLCLCLLSYAAQPLGIVGNMHVRVLARVFSVCEWTQCHWFLFKLFVDHINLIFQLSSLFYL